MWGISFKHLRALPNANLPFEFAENIFYHLCLFQLKHRDALVRIVQKGDSVTSGIVRISDQYKDIKVIKNAGPAAAKPTIPPQPSSTAVVRQSGIVPKPNVITRPPVQRATVATAATVVPVNQQKRPASQPNKITRPSSVQQVIKMLFFLPEQVAYCHYHCLQFTRTSLSPATSPNTSTGSTAKAAVTRMVQKPTPTQTEKLVALQRHGDLKITRKTFSPANVSLSLGEPLDFLFYNLFR